MYRKGFVHLCSPTIITIYTILYIFHIMLDMKYTYEFQDIQKFFSRVTAYTDGQAGRQTHRQIECIREDIFEFSKKNILLTISKF